MNKDEGIIHSFPFINITSIFSKLIHTSDITYKQFLTNNNGKKHFKNIYICIYVPEVQNSIKFAQIRS